MGLEPQPFRRRGPVDRGRSPSALVDESRREVQPHRLAARHFSEVFRQQSSKPLSGRQKETVRVGEGHELSSRFQHLHQCIHELPLRRWGKRGPRQSGDHAVELVNSFPPAKFLDVCHRVPIDRDFGQATTRNRGQPRIDLNTEESAVPIDRTQNRLGENSGSSSEFHHRAGILEVRPFHHLAHEMAGTWGHCAHLSGVPDELSK